MRTRDQAAYGAALAFASAAVSLYWALGGAIDPSGGVDEYALRWHVFFWDLWFLLWGLVLAVAVRAARRASVSSAR